MPSFKTAFPSKYLKADDLGATRPVVTVATCDYEEIGANQKKDRKLVIHWVDAVVKPLVLNIVNGDTISELAGTDDYERWPGTRVQLFATTTLYQGKRVACTRLCAPPQPARKGTVAGAIVTGETAGVALPGDDDITF